MAVAAPPLVANLQVTMREVDDAIGVYILHPSVGRILGRNKCTYRGQITGTRGEGGGRAGEDCGGGKRP